MKKLRIPLFVALGVVLLGFILGSFLDLNLSQAIGNPHNTFAITIAALSPTIGFAGLALLCGGWIVLALRKSFPVWARVLFWIAAIGCLGSSIYFSGIEYFGENAFYGSAPEMIGLLISAPFMIGSAIGGYFLFRNVDNDKVWIVLLVACAVMFIALVPGTTVLKSIFHRPRFRAIDAYNGIPFHAWWQRCTNYADYIKTYGLTTEEFKSFPSGHTCEAALLLVTVAALPFLNPKAEKIQVPLFYCALAWMVFVAFCRILAGAHFLSDVSAGGGLIVVFLLIGNEILIRRKELHPEEAKAE